jgi:hypothetical protein
MDAENRKPEETQKPTATANTTKQKDTLQYEKLFTEEQHAPVLMVNNKPIRPLAQPLYFIISSLTGTSMTTCRTSSPSDKIMSPCSKQIQERHLHGLKKRLV